MKIFRVAACCVLGAFATGVATPQTQAEMIVGAWNCSSDITDGTVSGRMVYNADGMTDSVLTLDMNLEAGKAVAEIETRSTWRLTSPGYIQEQIISAKVVSAKLNGEDLPEAVRKDIGAGLLEELGPSTIEISSTQMVLVDELDVRTVCTR